MQELLEKITENNNSLPPPIFTEKCCDFFKQLDKVKKERERDDFDYYVKHFYLFGFS